MELKKPHPSRLVGGVETWNGLFSHPHVVDEISGRMPPERGVLAPHQDPSPGFQCQEDKFPQPLAAKLVGIELVEETTGGTSSSP